MNEDATTASAFANSWNNLPRGSVYTRKQFEDWFAPLGRRDIEGKRVLELGCGNGSLMIHLAAWSPAHLEGVDLGDSVVSANANMSRLSFKNWRVVKGDLTVYEQSGFDVVYCIGVLHHLKDPAKGFRSVLRNLKAGGQFHCWVYAKEGNLVVRTLVEPLRRIFSRFPWWFTKYFIATPIVIPFFAYAKTLRALGGVAFLDLLPLAGYSRWIAAREFSFFRHVAFDQIVTPQTAYIERAEIERWLDAEPAVDRGSVYIILRNGNSWKFGGRLSSAFAAR